MAPRLYPALDVSWAAPPDDETVDRLLAALDAASPTALEARPSGVRVFFVRDADRQMALHDAWAFDPSLRLELVEVPDEPWAERSQAGLPPVRVGRIVVAPPWSPRAREGNSADDEAGVGHPTHRIWIRIQPSVGFGTGHHQSTRLCLALLQALPLAGRSVLDVGTGSGVLAIAAALLGAAPVVGIDSDADAVAAAADNVARNLPAGAVRLAVAELGRDALPEDGDVNFLVANLTGATLVRLASRLVSLTSAGGALIVSGLQTAEREAVTSAFASAGCDLEQDATEDEWVALLFRRSLPAPGRP